VPLANVIPYRNLLIWFSAIFALRVLLQFILQFTSPEFLPAFDLWHSETMPYITLLFIQCVILALMVLGVRTASSRRVRPRLSSFLFLLACVYFIGMVFRLVVGAFDVSGHTWFNGAISTAFHFGLAGYLLVYASSLKGSHPDGSIAMRWRMLVKIAAYPCVLIGSYLLFIWLQDTGSPLMFSAYLCVLIGGSAILLHETLAPNREDWRPDYNNVVNDGMFLVTVQVALPAVLKGLALVAVVWLSKNNILPPNTFWPQQSPVLVQVVLMLIVAEFFRYWIHRASHKYKFLWKLHAVHHAADKLYTVNVGRFHPLDKTIQFLGDTLPFLLLGIAPEVFAAYFVVYALNGFYQHSNADVKLGPLNWIIAGPELHRWHHSAVVSEAHANYGNNLIVWDFLFGTRFLPKNKSVDVVGIGNSQWPSGFLPQLSAPFTTPTEGNTAKSKK